MGAFFRKKRSFFARFTVAGMILGLCFIFLFSFGGKKEKKPAEINLLSVQDPFFFAMEEVASMFEEETGITVNIDGLAYDAVHAKIVSSFVGKSPGLDVVTVDQMWLSQYANNNWIVDLTPFIEEDKEEVRMNEFVRKRTPRLLLRDTWAALKMG